MLPVTFPLSIPTVIPEPVVLISLPNPLSIPPIPLVICCKPVYLPGADLTKPESGFNASAILNKLSAERPIAKAALPIRSEIKSNCLPVWPSFTDNKGPSVLIPILPVPLSPEAPPPAKEPEGAETEPDPPPKEVLAILAICAAPIIAAALALAHAVYGSPPAI